MFSVKENIPGKVWKVKSKIASRICFFQTLRRTENIRKLEMGNALSEYSSRFSSCKFAQKNVTHFSDR